MLDGVLSYQAVKCLALLLRRINWLERSVIRSSVLPAD